MLKVKTIPWEAVERLCETELKELIAVLPSDIQEQLPEYTIKFFHNSHTAGRCRGISQIELNRDLLDSHRDEQLGETLPHELAHCLTHQFSPGAKPHGYEWKTWMAKLGRKPEVCHRMEQPHVRRNRQKRIPYVCDCGKTYQFTTARHNKVIVDGRTYICKQCRGELRRAP